MGLHRNRNKATGRPDQHGSKYHLKFRAPPSKRWRRPPRAADTECCELDLFAPDIDGSPDRPVQRNAANARERARMQVLSGAFLRLKTCLPWVPKDTKLSKLDTLRLATSYIAYLIKILREDDRSNNSCDGFECAPHPVALTWPYTINSRSTFADCPTVPAAQDNSFRVVAAPPEYHPNEVDFRNLVPCEYVAMNQPDATGFIQ